MIWRSAIGARSPIAAMASGNDAAGDDATDRPQHQEHVEAGGESREQGEQAQRCKAGRDAAQLADRIRDRPEEGLAQRVAGREGGRQDGDLLDRLAELDRQRRHQRVDEPHGEGRGEAAEAEDPDQRAREPLHRRGRRQT